MRNPLVETMKDPFAKGLELARKLGASATKITLGHSETTSCSFEAARLKETKERESASYHIEVVVNGRKGNASGNRLKDLNNMVESAVTLAKVGSVAHFETYPSAEPVQPVKSYSEKTMSLSREQMIDGCAQIVAKLKEHDPDLHIHAAASRTEYEGLLVTSGGVCHARKSTHWGLGSHVQRTKDTDILMAGYGRGWRDLNEFHDPDVIAEKILLEVRRAERTAPAPLGTVKAYFPPESFPMILYPILMGINGRNVAKSDSPLSERLNEQVLASSITIVDDPHRDYASGSEAMDNDGIPTQKQTLFENGVLCKFLYDLDSAGLAGAQPTGNNGCSPYIQTVRPGERASKELLESIDNGIYILDLIGFGQSNIMNGDISCNVGLGYRIENGEIVGRVKDTMISGNLYQLLAKNVVLSSDREYQDRFPHAVIEGLNVSSKT